MTDEDDRKGAGEAKIWVGSQLPDKIRQFCERLEKYGQALEGVRDPDPKKEAQKVTLLELELFVSQTFVGEAESDCILRYIAEVKRKPFEDRPSVAPDGTVHRVRYDMSFNSPVVRDKFYTVLFNELRKHRLKMDQISALAYAIGSWRQHGEDKQSPKRPSGGRWVQI
ncbi:MAG TPA: hypothetical protein VEY12_04920 [Thermoplasmata archaeon]|nr:hypothetical protein [Thermoplasmata archaeon]